MIKNIRWVLILCVFASGVLCFASCKKKITNRQDLIAYINEPQNGLQKAKQIGDIKVTITYRPAQLMLGKNSSLITKAGKENDSLYKNQLFFVLSISAKNKELLRQLEFSKYSEMVQVLAFRMKEFISGIPGDGKPVEPLDCVFQQTYGMGSANNVLIVFNKKELLRAPNLKIGIKEFGLQTGNLDFEFKTEDIKNLPTTVLN